MAKAQYSLTEMVIRSLSKSLAGSGILVFVSGMADITELNERYSHYED